ncbi:fimbria/pilus outer membrane usher protein [Tatumella punctata]|uniref:Fimbria/pilus outer membrane usher protein n=1 Tax=Tatumella punctata TaxID=399969 RepID=A0ABW1VPR0_9GAMM
MLKNGIRTALFVCLSSVPFLSRAQDDGGYIFDKTLLQGSGLPVDDVINYISHNEVKPGYYPMDINLNGVFLFHGEIQYKNHNGESIPCFSVSQIKNIPFNKEYPSGVTSSCVFLTEAYPRAFADTDFGQMTVNITVPDTELVQHPRGYVSPDRLDAGETMLLTNYSINQYYSRFKRPYSAEYKSTWLGLNNAMNIGEWQFRYQGSWTRSDPGISLWSTNRAYVQRPVLGLRSNVTIGDSYSSGSLFSGIAFRGVVLKSDDRMLPQSQRGYAPVINGVANSNAKVTVRQGNSLVYEKTVPPGPFVIRDINPLSYSGDLTVTVTEANGSVNTFVVPYSSLPESIRPGVFKYSATLGRPRYIGGNDIFSEVTTQYGLSNSITANAGSRLAKGYIAGVAGLVYASPYGAFGLDSTFSRANLPTGSQSGWMLHANYSKRVNTTDTTLAIASYRYSTTNYRDLSDYFGLKNEWNDGASNFVSSTLNQESRFEASLTQDIGEAGNLWLSGSIQSYRDGRSNDRQYQLGYNKVFSNGVTFNVSVSRTRYSVVSWGDANNNYNDMYNDSYYTHDQQTLSSFSLSIPFGTGRQSNLSTTLTQDKNAGSSLQSTLSGTLDTSRPVSYGITYSRDNTRTSSVGITGQTATPMGSVQGTLSHGKSYDQGSASMQGAVVIHRDGITAGPYLGETFALIEAKGARGAKVLGVSDATIDRFGFALTPSIAPYQYNTVSLDSSEINSHTEIVSGSQRIAPYAGAMVRIKFDVIHGYPMLMTLQTKKNIPMGASIYNHTGVPIGTVGQGNMAWVRNNKLSDVLSIRWGKDESCNLHYHIPDDDKDDVLIKVIGECD